MEESNWTLRIALSLYLSRGGRGIASEMCANTEVTAPEISNWLAGRRDLPDHKLVAIYDWLISSGRATVTFN